MQLNSFLFVSITAIIMAILIAMRIHPIIAGERIYSLPTEDGKDISVEKLIVGGQMYMSIFLSSNVDITKKMKT